MLATVAGRGVEALGVVSRVRSPTSSHEKRDGIGSVGLSVSGLAREKRLLREVGGNVCLRPVDENGSSGSKNEDEGHDDGEDAVAL